LGGSEGGWAEGVGEWSATGGGLFLLGKQPAPLPIMQELGM